MVDSNMPTELLTADQILASFQEQIRRSSRLVTKSAAIIAPGFQAFSENYKALYNAEPLVIAFCIGSG